MCRPGEPAYLVPEPKNPADPNAVMVMSARGIQIGYVRAEYAPWYKAQIAAGRLMEVVFQEATEWGAVVRVAFDGEKAALPQAAPVADRVDRSDESDGIIDADPGFYPDEDWPE